MVESNNSAPISLGLSLHHSSSQTNWLAAALKNVFGEKLDSKKLWEKVSKTKQCSLKEQSTSVVGNSQ